MSERSSVCGGLALRKISAPTTPAAAKAIEEVMAMTRRNMARETKEPIKPPARSPVMPGVRVNPPGWKVGSPVSGRMVVPTKAPMASPKRKKTGLMTRAPTSQSRSPAMSAIPRGTEPPSGRDWARTSVESSVCITVYCWDARAEISDLRPGMTEFAR